MGQETQGTETALGHVRGIAHELNNMLMVIRTFSEVLARELPPESRGRKSLGRIQEATDRAATLADQLLAIGREQKPAG